MNKGSMETSDYPSLYAASDKASNLAKKRYYRLLGAQLLVYTVISLAAMLSAGGGEQEKFFSRVSAFLLGVSLLLAWINKAQHYDRVWYECRAIAESIKTLTWRYMMQAEPFGPSLETAAAKRKFLAELKELRKVYGGGGTNVAEFGPSPTIFSQTMDDSRAAAWQQRKERYLQDRLEPERAWYAHSARASSQGSEQWLWLIIILQIIAFFFAVVQPSVNLSFLKPVPLLITLASSVTAWNQSKRRDEVAQSYLGTAQALAEFQGVASLEIVDEASFEIFVATVEQTLARERSTWLIRKSVPTMDLGHG
jgi:hypothetical protein